MPALQLFVPRRHSDDHVADAVSAFESETQAVIQRTGPYSEHAILHAVGILFVVAIVFMALVKLDRVVTSTGKIVNTQGSLFLQPLEKSIVREILVTNGEIVRKGQTLATLDPTFATADLTQLQQKARSAQALVARLEAERTDAPFVASTDNNYSELQARIWQQRQAEHLQSLADFDARINAADAANSSAVRDVKNYTGRVELAQQRELMATTLEEKGIGSKLKTNEARDSRFDMQRLLSASQSQVQETQHALEALKAQREVYVQKWRDDLTTSLVAAQNDLDQAMQALTKASRVHELVKLEAPEDAVVLQIGSASVGSVVDSQSSQTPLFTLTPLRAHWRQRSKSTPRISASFNQVTLSPSNSTPIPLSGTAPQRV